MIIIVIIIIMKPVQVLDPTIFDYRHDYHSMIITVIIIVMKPVQVLDPTQPTTPAKVLSCCSGGPVSLWSLNK